MYDFDMNKIKSNIKTSIIMLITALAITLYMIYRFSKGSPDMGLTITLILLFGFTTFKSLFDVIKATITSTKTMDIVKELNAYGTLVKDIPYTLIRETDRDTAFYKYSVQVDYTLPNGETIKLTSKLYDKVRVYKDNKTIDLVINVDDPDVYYIDFNINRFGGNKEEDYYKETK